MESRTKFSRAQIQSMKEYAEDAIEMPSQRRDLKFLFHPHTPKEIYVKYTSYSLDDDNGINSKMEVVCVHPDGRRSDCYEQFESVREQMAFAKDFVEIGLDAQGRMLLL
jgi:hypothetical protein